MTPRDSAPPHEELNFSLPW